MNRPNISKVLATLIATFEKLHRIFKIHHFLILNEILIWSLSKIKTSLCAWIWWVVCISSVEANVYVYCSLLWCFTNRKSKPSLQTSICSVHKIWQEQNASYLSRMAAPLCCALEGTGLSTMWPLGEVTWQPPSVSLSSLQSPRLPARITVTFGSSSFVVLKPFISRWRKWLLDSRQTIQTPTECHQPHAS